jgi:pimeloyl-ACP methyl ester carboxylesterase
MRGSADMVATPEMVAAFTAAVRGGEVTTFERSGHFAYLEEPDAYCQVVTEFVLAHAG